MYRFTSCVSASPQRICKKPWNLRKYSLKMQGCPCQGIERHIPRMMMKGIYILLYSSELDIISSNVQNRKQKCEIYMKFSSVDQASHHGHGLESFQLLIKLKNLLWWSFFTFITFRKQKVIFWLIKLVTLKIIRNSKITRYSTSTILYPNPSLTHFKIPLNVLDNNTSGHKQFLHYSTNTLLNKQNIIQLLRKRMYFLQEILFLFFSTARSI